MEYHLISSAAKQAGVGPDTVRSYCRQGLMCPIRDSAGRRLFTCEDVKRIREIYLENIARSPSHNRVGR